MTTTSHPGALHLHHDAAAGEEGVAALRRQLAACLCTGVKHLCVHVPSHEDLDLQVLQALNGVAGYLRRTGGTLTLVDERRPSDDEPPCRS